MTALAMPATAQSEDALLAWARGFGAPVVAPGDSIERPLAISLRTTRLAHRPFTVTTATFARAAAPERIEVPAGTFDADVARVRVQRGRTWTFWIERTARDRKSTRLNSSHIQKSRMPSSA